VELPWSVKVVRRNPAWGIAEAMDRAGFLA
jgi:hypothetical protein